MNNLVLIIFGIWLSLLTVIFSWLVFFFLRLTKDHKEGNLFAILNKVLEKEAVNQSEIISINQKFKAFEEQSEVHIQKVSVIRFNPFDELGGDHSFALTLLDGKDNGFLISSLHMRDRTRVYLKSVKRGKTKLKLSKEEEKSLSLALKS